MTSRPLCGVGLALLAMAVSPALAGSASASSCEFMMPVLTVNEATGGSYDRLPFSFVRTGDNEPLKILIADDTPSGSGASIRSSVWLAAIAASMYRRDPMNGVRITVEFAGNVDGPSAGGVMCLSILAAMDGRKLPADFAMTGTIMPDGTIGTVGGVALKVRAAIRRGCKRICIPMFMRFEKQDDGSLVDLFRLGEREHVTVKPVRSVGEAYSFLFDLEPPPFPMQDEFAISRLPREVEDILVERCKRVESEISDARKKQDRALLSMLKQEKFFENILFDTRYVREYVVGRLLSSYEDVTMLSRAWTVLPTWIENYAEILKKLPVLEKNPPFSPNDRREFIAAIKVLQDKFKKDSKPIFDLVSLGVGDEQGSGYVRDSAGVSEIAAQCETSSETVATAAGLLLYMHMHSADLDKADELSDEQVAELFQVEMRKEFARLCCQDAIERDSDATVREAIFRHYASIRPGANLERTERLFHSAWLAADASLDANIVKSQAEKAQTTQSVIIMAFAAKDLHFASYIFAKARAKLAHTWLDNPDRLSDRRYHAAAMLCLNAKMLATSYALLVKHGGDVGGHFDDEGTYKCESPAFLNYLIRRARVSALISISDCMRAGVPCLNALRLFEAADGKNMGEADAEDLLHDVLEPYWAAALDAKGLLMSFAEDSKRTLPPSSAARPSRSH